MSRLSLTKRYVIALTFIAVFIVLSNAISQKIINANHEYGKIINISGKQRMLSQKLINIASEYFITKDIKKKTELQKLISMMERDHKFLLSQKLTPKLKNLYEKYLNSKLNLYLQNFKNILRTDDIKYLHKAQSNSGELLLYLNKIVKEYETCARKEFDKLSVYETYLMYIALFVLLLEALFIFRPAVQQIDKMTQAIQDEKEYEETVIESSNNAIIAIDWTGKITTYNKKAQEIFGWSKEDMLGTRELLRIIPPKYRDKHTIASQKYLQTGKSSGALGKSIELEGLKKDGTVFPITISFGSKYKPKNAIVVASIIDISEKKEQEFALIQQSKMASMGEMISNIAHQWRQPLSIISTIASGTLTKKEYGILKDEDFTKSMHDIEQYVQFLSKTIDDFRNFYKVSKDKTPFYLINSLEMIETIIRDSYKVNEIEIIKQIEDKNLKTYGVESQLGQVILNLFNNAKDILIEKEVEKKLVYIVIKQLDDEYILIEFYDNAGGVPENIIDKVFEPYFTTKHKTQGTGIGLHMSYEIIHKQFGGEINVCNKDFKLGNKLYYGACFHITLPVYTGNIEED